MINGMIIFLIVVIILFVLFIPRGRKQSAKDALKFIVDNNVAEPFGAVQIGMFQQMGRHQLLFSRTALYELKSGKLINSYPAEQLSLAWCSNPDRFMVTFNLQDGTSRDFQPCPFPLQLPRLEEMVNKNPADILASSTFRFGLIFGNGGTFYHGLTKQRAAVGITVGWFKAMGVTIKDTDRSGFV